MYYFYPIQYKRNSLIPAIYPKFYLLPEDSEVQRYIKFLINYQT